MIDQKIIKEITSLDPLRLQNVFGLFNSIVVLELYSHIHKRLFLVVDINPNTRTIYIQKDRPHGLKTKSNFISLLNKYVVGQKIEFFSLNEEGKALKAVFHDDYCLLIELHPKITLGFFHKSESIAFFKKPLNFEEGYLKAPKKDLGLKENFALAKIHEEKLLSFYQKTLFERHLVALKRDMVKKQKLLNNLKSDLAKCQKNLSLSHDAELLRHNLHLLTKGMKSATLTDYGTTPPSQKAIALDPKLSPKDFLKKTFDKIKRAERGMSIIAPKIASIEEEIKKGQEDIKKQELLDFKSITLKELGKELIIETKKNKSLRIRLPYKTYLSSDGTKILVGRSAKDSDDLTLHYAKGNEWWFHAEGSTGAHVIAKGTLLLENTFLEAVLLAHHFSKRRNDSRAVVQYTRIKNIKKTKGLAPGKVLITQEKTCDIKVDEEHLKAILNREQKS